MIPNPRFRSHPRSLESRWGRPAVALVAVLAVAFALAAHAEDPASTEVAASAPAGEIRFAAKNLVSTADGVFQRWRLTKVEIDTSDPGASVVELEVDIASLDTGIDRRDDHLRTSDFFDVERFPLAKVRVRDARQRPDGSYTAKFDLEIHGVAKTVDGSFEIVATSPLEVRGELPLDRMDFEIGEPASRWNPMSIRQAVAVSFRARLGDPSQDGTHGTGRARQKR